MKKIAFVLLLLSAHAQASHIVGGEFRMLHLTGYEYRIDLIVYFDELNGNPGSVDNLVSAKIFRNSDNAFIRTVNLPFSHKLNLDQPEPACGIALRTSELTYTTKVMLPPEIFNDAGGYYVVWERCCRNYSISNIQSNDPSTSLQAAGQTFILQFPPVIKNAITFTNSSPQLPTPLTDYACIGRMFYADLAGVDVDGDSLVYSLATPLSTHSFDAFPPILPKPYPEILWRSPFNSGNIMGGIPDLMITTNGLVTVTPTMMGLFGFAVKCEEYRDGVKIGEVRREYQLLTLECPSDVAPEILGKSLNGSYSDLPLDVHFDATVPDDERCLRVMVTDNDIFTAPAENIRIRAVAIDFDADVSGILPSIVVATLSQAASSAEFSICLSRCPLTDDGQFQIGIIAYDDACGVALSDTIRINVSMDFPETGCLKQTIDFPSIGDKTLGDPPFTLNAASSSGLTIDFASYDVATASISGAVVTMFQSGRVTIRASQSGDGNFKSAVPVDQSFCINPLPPVLTQVVQDSSFVIQSSSPIGNIWYKDGVWQPELGGSSIQVRGQPGTYTARVMVDICTSEPSTSLIVTGVDEDFLRAGQIFPNPVTSNLNLFFRGNERTRKVGLYDIQGRRLWQSELVGETHLVSMEGMQPGIYVVKIENEKGVYIRKVFKK